METPEHNPRSGQPRSENVLLTRVGTEAVLRPLENVTIDEVKAYVEAERKRSRRAMVWTSTLLFCVFLFFTIVFLLLGLYMVKENRGLAEAVNTLQSQNGANAQAAAGFSDGINAVYLALDNVDDRVDMIEKSKTSLHQEYDALLVDMQRIKEAFGTVDDKIDTEIGVIAKRLNTTETQLRMEIDELRIGYPDSAATPSSDPERETLLASPAHGDDDKASGSQAPPADAVSTTGPMSEPGDGTMTGMAYEGDDDHVSIEALSPPVGPREIQVISYPNGDRYEGEIRDGLLHGWGVYFHQNGDRYEGQFDYDMKHGSGIMVYASGDRYEGEFASDMRSGKGRMYYINGDKYVGEFAADKRNGNGLLVIKGGNRYSGGFKDDRKHGNGTLEFTNGDRYIGAFDNGSRSGKGTYEYVDGGGYVGEFKDGLRHGRGKYSYPGGDSYDGQFVDGKREGEGVFVHSNGNSVNGLWKNGEFLRTISR